MAYDVAVPRSLPPKFPDRCVLCGADNPGKLARFHAGAGYGAFFFVAWFESGKKSIMAPACGSCAVGSLNRSLLRFAFSVSCALLAAWLLFWGLKIRGLVKIKALGVFFAAVIPVVVWDWLFPPRFSVSFDEEGHKTICHFHDVAYAAEFDALNNPVQLESLELPDDLQLDDQSPAEPLVLPASFNPAASAGPSNPGFPIAPSYEDKTNPFRNLEDPRFRK